MSYSREQVIEKVRKCLALAAGTTPEEAQTAMLHAQKLMAKYHVAMADIADTVGEAKEEKIVKVRVESISLSRQWVRNLAQVVAKNFRCVTYIASWGSCHRAVFMGYETDANVAEDVFKVAFKFAERCGNNRAQLCNDRGQSSAGVKASFCSGFVVGLGTAYEEQVSVSSELALMVVAPKEAQDKLKGLKTFKGGIHQMARRDSHFEKGYSEGYAFANRRQIEGK